MGRKLFQRSPVTIDKGVGKVEDLLRMDKSLEETLKRMRDSLVNGRKRKYRVSVVSPQGISMGNSCYFCVMCVVILEKSVQSGDSVLWNAQNIP